MRFLLFSALLFLGWKVGECSIQPVRYKIVVLKYFFDGCADGWTYVLTAG
jgi:hypothetical protein